MILLIYIATLGYFWHTYFSTEFVILYVITSLISIVLSTHIFNLVAKSIMGSVLALLKFVVFTITFYLLMKFSIKEYYYVEYTGAHMKSVLLFILSYFAFVAQDLLPHQLRH